jgi:NAD(P)-dependent dehydrogenase (short-subunit alcohol dehydrogenase family)
MPGRMQGKVALVTGGGSGIGRAAALAFAREGARVAVADVVVDGGEETCRQITAAGGEAIFVPADVSEAAAVEAMVRSTVERYGRLDCALNNAGIGGGLASIIDCEEEAWDRVIAVNLKGVWLCMKYEIPQMLSQRRGAIVNTASVAGLIGSRGFGAYGASKHGVVGLTKIAALEFASAGIRVNAICPGWIRTPMVQPLLDRDPGFEGQISTANPSGRIGRPEEIAETVLWLCSDAASYVTGHAMVADGGLMAGLR